MKEYEVYIDGLNKGIIYFHDKAKRWFWFKEGRGKEPFPPDNTKESVLNHICKLCNGTVVTSIERK